MTREDWHAFRTTETCHVCDKPLEGDSVRDHCHITGKYRGAAHNACNLKPQNHHHPGRLPQSAGLWLPPADAGHFQGGGRDKLYPQQHGEVYLLLPRASALHWHRPIPASLYRQAGCGKPTRGFPDNSPTRAQQRKTRAPNEEGCVPLRVHGHLGSLHRAQTPPEGGLLQQALWCAYQWRGLRPCAKGLGDIWVQDPGWLQRPVLPHQHPAARWRVLYGWAMSQYLPTGGFRWVDDCQQLAKTIVEQPADSPEGYILEVDLEYPEDLHDAHNS